MNENTESFFITEEAGLRLDKALALHYKDKSRTYFQYLIENKAVLLNGTIPKKRILVKPGDEIEVCFILTEELAVEPEEIILDIIYEDEAIIVINKPYNMTVHPAPGNWKGTFVNALLYHCQNIQTNDNLRPGIVHRLDKETSGVLVAAKTIEAHRNLVAQFAERKVQKEYLAVSYGTPKQTQIDEPIGRSKVNRKLMAISSDGKKAFTEITILEQNEKINFILAKPKTGRTHQIRVHLKHVNAPIIGDATYGIKSINEKYKITRQLLHAYKIKLKHPITSQELSFTAPLPADFKDFITNNSSLNF